MKIKKTISIKPETDRFVIEICRALHITIQSHVYDKAIKKLRDQVVKNAKKDPSKALL